MLKHVIVLTTKSLNGQEFDRPILSDITNNTLDTKPRETLISITHSDKSGPCAEVTPIYYCFPNSLISITENEEMT